MTPRHFAWQAWHKLTLTIVLRGRRGTNSYPPSFCVAGVVQMTLGGALGLQRGRRGTTYTAKGSDIRPGIPRAPRFLRDRRGTM